jgi:hypothetical protein
MNVEINLDQISINPEGHEVPPAMTGSRIADQLQTSSFEPTANVVLAVTSLEGHGFSFEYLIHPATDLNLAVSKAREALKAFAQAVAAQA